MHFLRRGIPPPSFFPLGVIVVVVIARASSTTPHPSSAAAATTPDGSHPPPRSMYSMPKTISRIMSGGQPNNGQKHSAADGSNDADVATNRENSASNGHKTDASNCDSSCSSNCRSRNVRALIREESRGYDVDSPDNVPKRSNYLSWDDYFMAVAYLSGRRSKDPNPAEGGAPRDGACIVDSVGRIVGIGYAGFPRGCSDDCLPWASAGGTTASPSAAGKDGDDDGTDVTEEELAWLHTREPYLCHAEINAILNKCSNDVVGGRMFVPNFPRNECAKFIIQSGIREVVYVRDGDDSDSSRASRILFAVSGVKTTKMKPGVPSVKIDFGSASNGGLENLDVSFVSHARNVTRNEDEMERQLGLLQREASIDPFQFEVTKRRDYLSWDEYFMGVAFLSAMRSKDPNTQVGACIVDADRRIIGVGYNGFPRGCSDAVLPWARRAPCGDPLHAKYPYVVHAEANAILNRCGADARGATIYVALFPCNECSKVIIQSGIREVVYLDDRYHDTDACRASRIMFRMAGVRLRRYRPENEEIAIDFEG